MKLNRQALAYSFGFTLCQVTFACDGGTEGHSSPQAGQAGQVTATPQAGQSGEPATTGGSSGNGGSSGVGGAGQTLDGLLVDDFEDGDSLTLIPGGWYSYTDQDSGGLSTLSFTGATAGAVVMNGPGFQSQKSLEVSYAFDQGTYMYDPFVGFGASIGSESAPYDLTTYAGISYTYQGGAHRVQVHVSDVTDYDDFGLNLPASPTWKTVTLPFETFSQEGWGIKAKFDVSHVVNLAFALKGATGASAKLDIDNLLVKRSSGTATPDMTIQAAAPPADATLDSVTIDNPLQAKAMQYLTRGYNLTNWLEQDRFTGFTYDESFVEKLHAAGFRGLRLPIDLDLYVASTTGTGDSLAVTVSDDLWQVLDAFDAWTLAHGISLTIDYHQYGTLPDIADPDSVQTAVLLWGQVAAHFSKNTREDLFFELMNEPELSFGGTDPTQAQWGAIAERMVSAIRSADTTHSLIFGDVEWYGIDKLVSRQPLSDTNVIYAFHDYEPFIFTHQGASWANMGATHDLPYPYDPARWSQYYSALGFNASMEAWMLDALRGYYRTGNHSALRNHILSAKRWAVTNNVPVICNEFGAYDATSQLADRARYYTDLIGIFNELQIPWQHWFMIMAADGSVIPEYREAFQLDE
ncbi:MAG: CIA30 family protein [Polyangiaceae bacterium]